MKKGKINFEKLTEFVKKKNFIIAVCVFCLTMLTIGVSYASFFTVKTNTNNQIITTGTLDVTYTSQTSSVNGEDGTFMSSMSDEMGMAQTTASLIYIQNNGSLDSTYNLTVGYNMQDFPSGRKLTPIDYIMMAVYDYDPNSKTENLIVGPISMADLPIYSLDTEDYRNNRYALLIGSVNKNTSEGSTKVYKIKTWLSDKAISVASLSDFRVDCKVIAEVENSRMSYNFFGKIMNGNTPLSGAIVSFHNNSISSVTDTNGLFNINGVYPGVYNIDIIYDNKTYSGNLIVEEGSRSSLTSYAASFSGDNIYNIVKTNGTTINKIIKANDLDTYSGGFNLTSGNLATSYKYIGDANSDVNLNVELDTTNGVYTMSLF